MGDPAARPLEAALLFALDDLAGDNFRRFKLQLGALRAEGGPRIPRGRLERADTLDAVRLLLEAYGEEGALDVAVRALRAANLRDSAAGLLRWRRGDLRRSYQRGIQETFGSAAKQASAPAAELSLHRYAEPLLGRKAHPQEGGRELMSVLRKHQKVAAHLEHYLEVGVENLFGPDAEQKSCRTVVLLGPPGVGKTTAMRRLMLDWAAGRFGQRTFQYAFYISCRAANCSGEPLSVADLILGSSPPGTLLAEDIFADQGSLLFIVDGFEELGRRDLRRDVLSSDPRQKQAAAELVLALIGRQLLARCHLIVTTRPAALKALLPSLRAPQFVEVLGLCPAERRKYFHHFFDNEEEASQAFGLARSNETLFGLCFLPAVCWVICTVVRQKLPRDPLHNIPETATITEIYMRLLVSFLGCHSRPSDLEGLCSLAKDGTLRKTTAFSKDALNSHRLGSSGSDALSSGRKLLQQDEHDTTLFKFLHLSFQEFFAALFYLLDADGDPARSSSDVEELFADKEDRGSPSSMLVRFLFGLSSTGRLGVLQDAWGCKASRTRPWPVLLSWASREAARRSLRDRGRLMELCHCLYEMEDPAFAESVMAHVPDLDLREQLVTRLDFAALSYCLCSSRVLPALRLSGYELGPAGAAQLLPGLLKSSEIQLNGCGLVAATCRDLTAMVSRPTLTSLDLGDNPLGDGGVRHLAAGLLDPRCKLQTLRLHRCQLTAPACEPLSLVLAASPSLGELDLQGNRLGDEGVKTLSEGLKHPGSRLRRLTLHLCGLTGSSCEALASVLEAHEFLAELGLGDNSLGDAGVRQLCTALKFCKLQKLELSTGSLNQSTRRKLQAAFALQPQMKLICYYPPDLPSVGD